MSTELAPNRPAHAREPRPIDRLREIELRRRVEAGEDKYEAWARVATDARIGLVKWRGLNSIDVAACQRTYIRHVIRMSPEQGELARAEAERDAAAFAPEAIKQLKAIARGQFEEAPRANVQRQAVMDALKVCGVGADRQTRVTSTAIQVNVSGSLLSKLE